ncbi:NACHT, LRR and PYD domains-containing protein 14 [Actinomortierella wolfii]|nr:NACHT, LRR and PYD domains-containing protein 14 [Actinomortierella wolfii]
MDHFSTCDKDKGKAVARYSSSLHSSDDATPSTALDSYSPSQTGSSSSASGVPASSIPYCSTSSSTNNNIININNPTSEDDALYTQFQLQLHLQEAQQEDERRQLEYSLLHHSQQPQEPQQQQSYHHHHHHHHQAWTPVEPSSSASVAIHTLTDPSSTASDHGAIFNQAQPIFPHIESSSSLHMPSLAAQYEALASFVAARSASSAFIPSVHANNGFLASEQVFHTHDNPVLNSRCTITLDGSSTGTSSGNGNGSGSNGNNGGIGSGGGGGFGADGTMDCDEAEDDEYVPPSELKYILYEDHVSPITIQEALAVLNDHLYDPRVLDQSMDRDACGANSEGGLWSVANGCPDEENDLSYLDRLGFGQDEDEDENEDEDEDDNDNKEEGEEQRGNESEGKSSLLHQKDEELAVIFETRKHLPSPTSTEGAYPFPSMGVESPALTDGFKTYTDSHSTTGDASSTQQRSHGRREPDISFNLASQQLTPDHIHDLYFSRHYSRLVYLNLWDTNLGIWGAQAVGGLLADRTCRIQYLNLGRNRLGFEGMMQLSGMYKNHSLIELDLSDNQLEAKAVHCLQQMLVRLKKHKASNIRRLNLSNNEIKDVSCMSIAKILVGTPIQELDLSFNEISDWGASVILKAFTESRKGLTLETLNLEANPLTFASGVDLCKILTLPQSRVRHLDLRGAKVTDVVVPYLAEALKAHDCVLHTLNLYDCQLTDAGILKLAVKLCVNNSLRVLGLGANCIGDMGIAALSQGLCLNNRLEELDISENETPLSRASVEALLMTMQSNCTLLSLMIDSDPVHHHHHHHGYSAPRSGGMFDVFLEDDEDSQNTGESSSSATPQSAGATTTTATSLTGGTGDDSLGADQTTTATTTEEDEQAIAQERRRYQEVMTKLKSHVRLNHKRTMRLRHQCFETLFCARILMFGRDADPNATNNPWETAQNITTTTTTEVVRVYHDTNQHHSGMDKCLSIIPSHTGLPTPPLSTGSGAILGERTTMTATTDLVADTSAATESVPVCPMTPDDVSPVSETDEKGTTALATATTTTTTTTTTDTTTSNTARLDTPPSLVRLPWEIKETILFCLDEDRVLTRQQFNAILRHASSTWDTVRQPWERWGDVREAILEQTGCYYYTSG